METASVDELRAYIEELKGEIERVKLALNKRADVRSAAEALFKKS